jgi:Fe-S-cluster containining protein
MLGIDYEGIRNSNYSHKEFILQHWEPISLEDAIFVNPSLKEFKELLDGEFFYKCDLLGEDNLCGDYDNRPGICKGYPWYGQDPYDLVIWYSNECGFKEDLERYERIGGYIQKAQSVVDFFNLLRRPISNDTSNKGGSN